MNLGSSPKQTRISSEQSKEQALRSLLADLFVDDARLRLFFALSGEMEFQSILEELPSPPAPLEYVTGETVRTLRAHGLIDRILFDALTTQFPRRKADIDIVAQLWVFTGVTKNAHPQAAHERGTERSSSWFSLRIKIGPIQIIIVAALAGITFGIAYFVSTQHVLPIAHELTDTARFPNYAPSVPRIWLIPETGIRSQMRMEIIERVAVESDGDREFMGHGPQDSASYDEEEIRRRWAIATCNGCHYHDTDCTCDGIQNCDCGTWLERHTSDDDACGGGGSCPLGEECIEGQCQEVPARVHVQVACDSLQGQWLPLDCTERAVRIRAPDRRIEQ